jgi:membrane protein implicated in regulation of membrane protease activity
MNIITIYWILFGLGLGFAAISAIFHGFGEAMSGHGIDLPGGHDIDLSGGHDVDLSGGINSVDMADLGGGHLDTGDVFYGQGEISLSPVSTPTIFSFIGAFGGGGLIANYIGLNTWGTLLVAVPLGLVVAFGVYYLMYILNKVTGSSEARIIDTIGLAAEIITPITEEGMGEIAYVARGSRYNAPARSLDGKSIARGKAVKIWRVIGSTYYVKEILPEEADSPSGDAS